jgi:hypothetical protein
MVIIGFSWWVRAMGGEVNDRDLCDALDDLTWVVQCMADMPATSDHLIGGKRAQEDEAEASNKWYILSFPIISQANGENCHRMRTK